MLFEAADRQEGDGGGASGFIDGVGADTLTYLTAELADLESALTRLDGIEPLVAPGLLHGDAHLGNLIAAPVGPLICDFDSTAVGRREWDLIPAAVGTHRFGYTPDVRQGLARAYGLGITTWPGLDALRRPPLSPELPIRSVGGAPAAWWRLRLRLVCHDTVASSPLRLVQGLVGAAEKRTRICVGRTAVGDADAQRDRDRPGVGLDGRVDERKTDALGDAGRDLGRVAQDEGELLAAVAGEEVAGPVMSPTLVATILITWSPI